MGMHMPPRHPEVPAGVLSAGKRKHPTAEDGSSSDDEEKDAEGGWVCYHCRIGLFSSSLIWRTTILECIVVSLIFYFSFSLSPSSC